MNYKNVIYVNLVRDEFGFEDILSEDGIMERYCQNAGLPSYEDSEDTILLIDEIQESAAVYNSIRDLRHKLRCDIIVSGSYLARTVNSKDFFLPAGIAYLRMFPLSFREFCRTLDLEAMLEHVCPFGGDDTETYKTLENAYQIFRHIGGYPQVVTTYIKSRDEADCMDVLADLIQTFTAESSRFFSNSTALSIFSEAYKAVMVQIVEEKKGTGRTFLEFLTNFVKESVKEPVSRNEVQSAAAWLLYSGIIGYCDLYNNGDVTDVLSNRRIYFTDTGVASYISGMVTIQQDAIEGMLTETFAYTELNRIYQMPAGRKPVRGDKPCFSVCGSYELDFVVVDQKFCKIGIEVKSSENRAKSLAFYKEKGLIDKAFRAVPAKGSQGQKITTVPIYLIGARFEEIISG